MTYGTGKLQAVCAGVMGAAFGSVCKAQAAGAFNVQVHHFKTRFEPRYFQPAAGENVLDVDFLAVMPHTAYLKLADGCNNRCAYCTIPYIRGPFRSKPLEEVVAEARALAEAGARELSLIAQDTTSYGQDLYGGSALCAAIKKIARIKEVRWIRIMYAYPERVTAELIALMAREPKVCRYLDIPLQHISDPVLRAMPLTVRSLFISFSNCAKAMNKTLF